MSAKKMGLGRGLNTLIPKAPIVDEEDIEQVKKKVSRSSKTKKKEETKRELTLPIDKIEPNPDQPRNQFDEDTLQELADSIKQYECYSQSSLLQRMISMRSLQGREDGELQNRQD